MIRRNDSYVARRLQVWFYMLQQDGLQVLAPYLEDYVFSDWWIKVNFLVAWP